MAINGKPLNAKNTARLNELRKKKRNEKSDGAEIENNNSDMPNSVSRLKAEKQKGLYDLLTGKSIGSVGRMHRKTKFKISGRHFIC